jgi:serine protease Do
MKIIRRFVPCLLLFMLTAASCSWQIGSSHTETETVTRTAVINAGGDALLGLEATLENIYLDVNPSVVNISVILADGEAQASGFVWDNQGYIVTNNHVVDGASRISVTFHDGTVVDASLMGVDPDSDLAVIKVKPAGIPLKPVTMGDSTTVRVGQLALAIGNPFGLQGTLTVGFVSAVGRIVPASENTASPGYSIPDIIQTDTALNPGNSGGVLLDISGSVIGVTQSIATNSGGSSGVGFAIPASIVQQVAPALIKNGHYDHPYLGLSVVSLDPDITSALNLPPNQRGALIQTITAGGPADKAGLKAGQTQTTVNGRQLTAGGDIVIAINSQPVKSSDDLVTFLSRNSAGSVITLTLLRDGKQIDIKATLGIRPSG